MLCSFSFFFFFFLGKLSLIIILCKNGSTSSPNYNLFLPYVTTSLNTTGSTITNCTCISTRNVHGFCAARYERQRTCQSVNRTRKANEWKWLIFPRRAFIAKRWYWGFAVISRDQHTMIQHCIGSFTVWFSFLLRSFRHFRRPFARIICDQCCSQWSIFYCKLSLSLHR